LKCFKVRFTEKEWKKLDKHHFKVENGLIRLIESLQKMKGGSEDHMKKWSCIFLWVVGLTAIISPIVHSDAQSATPTWDQYCLSCHGSASNFGAKTVTQINNAINNVGDMGNLSTLTATQRQTISNELSGITLSGITITAPTPGEVVASGSPYTIFYDAPAEVSSVKVKYSLNGGVTWLPAALDPNTTPAPGTFAWDVPTPVKNATKALVKVTGYNASSVKVGVGKSAKFTVEVVSITAPIEQETVSKGISYTVTWTWNGTKSQPSSAKVFYTYGSSGIWKPAKGVVDPLLESFSWDVPSPAKAKIVKLKVVLRDDALGVKVGIGISKAFIVQ
jgi:hypothetical protein